MAASARRADRLRRTLRHPERAIEGGKQRLRGDRLFLFLSFSQDFHQASHLWRT
jgi:hypothetical protein